MALTERGDSAGTTVEDTGRHVFGGGPTVDEYGLHVFGEVTLASEGWGPIRQ